jgi:hypothetical protein
MLSEPMITRSYTSPALTRFAAFTVPDQVVMTL